MTIYSHNSAPPAPIPFRIILPNGATRTDPSTFTPEEIASAGYVEAPAAPEYDPATQHAPVWQGSEWTVADKTAEELEAERKAAIPQVVTMRQARLALHGAGLLPQVDSMMSDADPAVLIEWEYATEVRRDHPMIAAMAGALDISEEAVDDLFVQAAGIE